MISASAIRKQNALYLMDTKEQNNLTNKVYQRNAKTFYDEVKKIQDATSGFKPTTPNTLLLKDGNQSLHADALRNQFKDILSSNSTQNKLQKKVQDRENKQAQILLMEKKALENPDMITINPNWDFRQEIANLIVGEAEHINKDPKINKDRAYFQLLQLTGRIQADDILERLSEDEILFFNKNFPQIKEEVKTKYTRLTKEEFIRLLRDFIDNNIPPYKQENLNETIINFTDEEPSSYSAKVSPDEDEKLQAILSKKRQKDITMEDAQYLYKVANLEDLSAKFLKAICDYLQISYDKARTDNRYFLRKISSYEPEGKEEGEEGKEDEGNVIGFGFGRKPKSVIIKRAEISKPQEYISIFDDRYLINSSDLKNGYLNIKLPSKRPMKNFNREKISRPLQELILKTIDNEYDLKEFMKLKPNDRRVFKRFNSNLKLGLDVNDEDNEFEKRYEVLIGQLQSGNNAPQLKREIRLYLIEAVKSGLITRNQLLEELVLLGL